MRPGCGAVVVVILGAVGCAGRSSAPAEPLQGAWRVAAMHLISADQDTVPVPVHESLLIFGDGYYSIGYAFGGAQPPDYAERWHPSDREKVERFSSLIVNAGSYVVRGSRLEVRPLFALAPEFVGGRGEFAFQFSGDTLALTWAKSIAFDGLEYPSGGSVTLLHLVRME